MSWLIAGIMTGISTVSADKASDADRAEVELANFQDSIEVEQLKGDVAIQEYNMRTDLAGLEGEQVAMASAMGKRSSGEGFKRMQEVQREDLELNVERGKSEVSRAEKFGAVSASARERGLKARKTTRDTSAMTSGLLSFSRAMA